MTDQTENCFKSHKEMWVYLMSGKTARLYNNPNVRITMDEDGNVSTPYNLQAYGFWKPYEEPKWYENIPGQGVLCGCWHPRGLKTIRNITKFRADNTVAKFEDDFANHWEYAEPLNYKEVVNRIYNPNLTHRRQHLLRFARPLIFQEVADRIYNPNLTHDE